MIRFIPLHAKRRAARCRPGRALAWTLLAACAFGGPGCGERAAEPVRFAGETMGTWYRVTISILPVGLSREAVREKVEARLQVINARMSTYRPDSEISRFNRHAEADWFPVSAETAGVVHEALRVSRLTRGAFDATVGPLVNLWAFGPESREPAVPAADEIARRRAAVGFQALAVRLVPPALRKRRGQVEVDLSGIAKGHGVDQVAVLLKTLEVPGGLVDIGGEVRAFGTRPDGKPWKIGIEAPDAGARRVRETLPLEDRAVATSGDYRNFFVRDGKRYSHTIDPRTGRPVEHGLASVTVVAGSCAFADAMATGLMVLGPEEGYRLAAGRDLAALFLIRADAGISRKATPAFTALSPGR